MKLFLLGTGASVSDPHRTVTMLAVQGETPDGRTSTLLIDCGGDAVQRLLACGIDLDTLDAVFVTHEHADHASGFTLLVQKLWLHERRRPIPIYGIEPALAQARRVWDAFDTEGWKDKGLPDLHWRTFPHEAGAEALSDETWHVTAAPAKHPVPTVGLRIEHRPSGRVLAYSCDTAPHEPIVELSREADLLVHEANGAIPGVHASAEEAAQVAAKAGAHRLVLVHLPPGCSADDLGPARQWFTQTEYGEELGVYEV
jgi:ribonuclease Z